MLSGGLSRVATCDGSDVVFELPSKAGRKGVNLAGLPAEKFQLLLQGIPCLPKALDDV
jgi:hypothetical protein